MRTGKAVADYFGLADSLSDLELLGERSPETGYYRLGSNITFYGRSSVGSPACSARADLYDVERDIRVQNGKCLIPFDPKEVVDGLRYGTYATDAAKKVASSSLARRGYYLVRPLLTVQMRKHLQRFSLRGWEERAFPSWPVDRTVDRLLQLVLIQVMKSRGQSKVPFIWFWPDGKTGCAVMTHDVETSAGLKFCGALMDLNDSSGIKSSFQLIPEARYEVTRDTVEQFRQRGFEVNVHDWNHDGHLFSNREVFLERAAKINGFASRHGIEGFRSGALYRNVEWYDAFSLAYDMSVPNVGHLDPQPGGCCTVMPYFIGDILEIPVTTTQDYSLWHILGDYSLAIWKRQLALILEDHGLASFIVHPDYILEARARATYRALLEELSALRSGQGVWIARAGEVNRWWRDRSQMKLVQRSDGTWHIEGASAERARVAYAVIEGERLVYGVEHERNRVSSG